MNFDSISDFIAMGGHGLYVWIAYGVFTLVFVANVLIPKMKRREIIQQQAQRLKRERVES